MKSVTLKLNVEKLDILNKVWECRKMPVGIATREERVVEDVANHLAKRLRKKAIDKEFNIDDFEISFTYSDAHFLECILLSKKELVSESIYEDTVFLKTINQINQQLA